MELNNIHPLGARMLADAIVEGAVRDLGKAYMRYLQDENPLNAPDNYRAVKRSEMFFRTQLYGKLTGINGKWLIKKTKDECKDIVNNYLTHYAAKGKYHLSSKKLANATYNGIVRTKGFCGTYYVNKADIERWLAYDT